MQVTDVAKTLFSVKKMKDSGNIVIFGADEGDMIINKSTGMRTPIVDTGKEFVLDIYVPGGSVENSPGRKEGKEKITYGCEATQGGFWNAIMQEEEEEPTECQVCCPATFRRHP